MIYPARLNDTVLNFYMRAAEQVIATMSSQ